MPRGVSAAAAIDRHPVLTATSATPVPRPRRVPLPTAPPVTPPPSSLALSTSPDPVAALRHSAAPSGPRSVSIPARHTLPAALAPVGDRCGPLSSSSSSLASLSPVESPDLRARRRFFDLRTLGLPRSRLSAVPPPEMLPARPRHKFEFAAPRPGMCDVVEIQRRVVRSLNNPRQQLRHPTPPMVVADAQSVVSAPAAVPAAALEPGSDGQDSLPRLHTLLVQRSAALPRLVYLHGQHNLRAPSHRPRRAVMRWAQPPHAVSTTTEPPDAADGAGEKEERAEKAAGKTEAALAPETVSEVTEAPTEKVEVPCVDRCQETQRDEYFAVLDHGFSPVPSGATDRVVLRQGSSSYRYLDAVNGRAGPRRSSPSSPCAMYKQSEYNMYQHRKYTRMVHANRSAPRRQVRFQEPQVMRFLKVNVA